MPDDYLYLDESQEINRTHGNLPHWNQGHKIYFVTFRLADSLPLDVIHRYEQDCLYMEQVIKMNGGLPEDWKAYKIKKHNKVLHYLDNGYGSCVLRLPAVRQIVNDALRYVDGKRCQIHAYVVMPNHVHLLVELFEGESITKVIGSVKQFSSKQINALSGKSGKVWQREIHDRIIRNVAHYNRSVRYIAHNPRCCDPGTYSLFLQPDQEEIYGVKSVD